MFKGRNLLWAKISDSAEKVLPSGTLGLEFDIEAGGEVILYLDNGKNSNGYWSGKVYNYYMFHVEIDWGDGSGWSMLDLKSGNVYPTGTDAGDGEIGLYKKYDYAGFYTVQIRFNSPYFSIGSGARKKLYRVHGQIPASYIGSDQVYGSTWESDTGLFNGCENLIRIPSGLLSKCRVKSTLRMFYGCRKLMHVPSDLLASQTALTEASRMFQGCSMLQEIPTGFFDSCSKLQSVNYTFAECAALQELPDDLFNGKTSLVSCIGIVQKTKLRRIGNRVFKNCSNLKNGEIYRYCEYAQYHYSNRLSKPIFGELEYLNETGSQVYYGCSSLYTCNTFEGASLLKSVGDGVFCGCGLLYYMDMFKNTGIEKIPDIFGGDEETYIKDIKRMFSGCTKAAEMPSNMFAKLYKPVGGNHEVDGEDCFENCGVKKIPAYAFYGASFRLTGSFPDTEEIGEYAFTECGSMYNGTEYISSFSFGPSLKTIAEHAFYQHYGDTDFSGCTALSDIGKNAFEGSYGKRDFYYCSALETIPEYMFKDAEIRILESYNYGSVDTGLFEGCTRLKTIGTGAFSGATLHSANKMFKGCSRLSEIPADLFGQMLHSTTGYDSNSTRWYVDIDNFDECFQDCSALKHVPITLFDEVYAAHGWCRLCFAGCGQLETVPKMWEDTSRWKRRYVYDYGYVKPVDGCFLDCFNLVDIDEIPPQWKEYDESKYWWGVMDEDGNIYPVDEWGNPIIPYPPEE